MKGKAAAPAEGFAARLIPPGITILLAVLTVVPFELPGYAAATPNFMLMSVYHWTIYRPDQLPLVAIFAIALLLDLMTTGPGSPIGLSPLLMVGFAGLIVRQRRLFRGRGFPFIWTGFAAVAALYGLATWALSSLVEFHLLEPRSAAFRSILTIALFPGFSWIFARLQRAFP
jgi:rod shape-determining protein MreD